MKDPGAAIRNAIFLACDGVVLHLGQPVPIYDGNADLSAPDQYIVLGSQTCNQNGDKQTFITYNTIIVHVVTRFDLTDRGNTLFADNIATQITQIVNPDPVTQLDLGPDFQLVVTNVEGSDTRRYADARHRFVEKAIRFQLIVNQH
ncbi:hypothetical protein [Chitinophaga rhizosphaerae]|uniref:hypothetical protein n=1 Tax=Chitinophaga rhizosphaerae TaxID=1864947 RepID=UPI000F808A02|nr:hypothetical protein [Chitinophaga rhizosphaerae]